MNEALPPDSPRTYPVGKRERLTLQVESLAYGGKGVAKVEGYTVFVEGALPGQKVEAVVTRRKKRYAEARLEKVLDPSPDQVEPRCADFGTCGGCALQHFRYEAQLASKREQVADCIHRIGGLTEVEVEPALPSPSVFEYRNKMEFTFSPSRWLLPEEIANETDTPDRFGLGLHVRHRFDRVVNVERCHLMGEEASILLRRAREVTRQSGLPPYSTRTHEGFWRFLVVREGVRTGERMVHIITHAAPPDSEERSAVDRLGEALLAIGVPITSLLHGVTTGRASVAVAETVRVLAGAPVIRDEFLGLTFEIGANTFFQTNPAGAEALFREALDRGGFTSRDTVWDLYCGVGALTLPLAQRVKRVVGMELVPQAVAAAKRNARLNRIHNVEFHSGDIRRLLASSGAARAARPDAVVLDPPREGLHADVTAALLSLAPARILYVSCNPATLARDAALLVEGGYRPGSVLPADLFPHTTHVESVMTFTRGDGGSRAVPPSPRPGGSRSR